MQSNAMHATKSSLHMHHMHINIMRKCKHTHLYAKKKRERKKVESREGKRKYFILFCQHFWAEEHFYNLRWEPTTFKELNKIYIHRCIFFQLTPENIKCSQLCSLTRFCVCYCTCTASFHTNRQTHTQNVQNNIIFLLMWFST